MYAVLAVRPNQLNRSSAVRRGILLAALVLLLSSCSTLQERPASDGTVHGAVLTESYMATLGSQADGSEYGAAPSSLSAATAHVLRAPEARDAFVPGQVLVQYRDQAGSEGHSSLSSTGPGRQSLGRTTLFEVGTEEDVHEALDRLSKDSAVLRASPNYYLYSTALPNDPYLPQQWSLSAAGVPLEYGATHTEGEPVVVAVIDSGFDLGHEDLASRFLPGYDFCADQDCSSADDDPRHGNPGNWHGTHVAGVIAAVGGNGLGVRGVADGESVLILPVKIFNDDGGGANTDVLIRALRWAAGLPVENAPMNANPARVINLSLAGDFPSEILQEVLDEVREAGALVISATGNAGIDRVMSPAAANQVVGVGATNRSFERSCFSNYGVGPNGPGGVDIVAPGGEADGSIVGCGIEPNRVEGLMSTIPADDYGSAVGTSMAAPMVSAIAGLILSRDPLLSPDELEEQLLDSAYFDAQFMSEPMYGAGVLRADRAFGLMGPGDTVTVELSSLHSGEPQRASVTLGLIESFSSFSFAEVPAGDYQLSAQDPETGAVFDRLSVTIAGGEDHQADLVLQAGQ
ncbi:MAG: S8 family serine peptidase [Trueperaceae bacterium]